MLHEPGTRCCMRPRIPLVLLVGAILTSGLWLLVLQRSLRGQSHVGYDARAASVDKTTLLAVVGVQVCLKQPKRMAHH